MNKESASKFAQVLRDAQSALLSVTSERDKLAAQCSAYERREEATKVASLMHDKGINRDVELGDLVEQLEKEAAAGRLPEIARAAEMIGPNMTFGSTSHNEVGGQGTDALTSYLMGAVG